MIVKLIVLTTGPCLVSEIEEVGADIGEPDCKLVKPMLIGESNTLSPWLMDLTQESEVMISSDKILTLCEPIATLKEKYIELTK